MLNLLSNAVKFNPAGGTIRVDAALRDGFAEISVTDTGIGIPAAEQQAVFDKSYRVGETTKRVREGTGLLHVRVRLDSILLRPLWVKCCRWGLDSTHGCVKSRTSKWHLSLLCLQVVVELSSKRYAATDQPVSSALRWRNSTCMMSAEGPSMLAEFMITMLGAERCEI